MSALTTWVTVWPLAVPEDKDVVAGWTAFVVFIALIVAVALLGVSLTRRLKNVERAAGEGKYDPSTERPGRPKSGLALMRQLREDSAAAEAAEVAETAERRQRKE